MALGGRSGGNRSAMSAGGGGLASVNVRSPLSGSGTALNPLVSAADLRATLVKEALEALELQATPDRLLFDWQPFFARGVSGLTAMTLTGTVALSSQTQFARVSCSTNSNRRWRAGPDTSANGEIRMFVAGAAKKVWAKLRFKLGSNLADDAVNQQFAGFKIETGSSMLWRMGVNSLISTSKYMLQANAGTPPLHIISTVNQDTGWHTLNMKRVGGVTSFWVDTETPQTHTDLRNGSDGIPVPIDVGVGGANSIIFDGDYCAWATERE